MTELTKEQIAQGWKLVPKRPTDEMINAGLRMDKEGAVLGIYLAMIAASPNLPSPPVSGEAVAAMQYACDLLAERVYGSPARSPGHNARLVLEDAIKASQSAMEDGPTKLEKAAKETLDWLYDDRLNTWPYLEGSGFGRDKQIMADKLSAAIGERE